MAPEKLAFLDDDASAVAPKLLGCLLERHIDGHILRGKIVEVEAYDQSDVASHSYNGETPRTKVMFGEYGHLYVYFTYGMHYCCNVVVGKKGRGTGILIRAIEPVDGIDVMEKNRGKTGVELTNGPAKVCQALSIGREHNGTDLRNGEVRLLPKPPLSVDEITVTTRIGISRGQDVPWRFYITGNKWVSKP